MSYASSESVGTTDTNPWLEVGGTESFWNRMAEKYPSATASIGPGNPMSGTVPRLLEAMQLLGPDAATYGKKLKVLDVACGTGVVPMLLAMHYNLKEPKVEVEVVAADFSADMVAHAVKAMQDGGWKGVKVEQMDAQNLTYPDNAWTHITCSFGAMIFPEPDLFFEAAHRTLAPGGLLGFTVWKSVGWAVLIPAIIKRIRPSDPYGQQPFRAWRYRWEHADFIESILARHSFVGVNIEKMEATLRAPNLDMLKKGMLSSVAEEIVKDWNEEEKAQWGDAVNEAAKEVLEAQEDGSVSIPMVAWIVTARKD
ncbi:S-adenosyl-L-methionine-dependent methyltransferase [Punctularia strigosozonata HHB-11173 SS5]|uniref:S-adenosyl-L-methionine-dependent methyltransferase n=1 Tax=Punctularia strigosozonata (strain HHB-11173) TaxID=741275 RepID=UPI00044172FC|nr:S-adenosyl-L-methionine-dependent methyltransferase [Punctularia strigosozonata HHB-11173 SS5]EIN05482.1 S-adenosyl-L-methionine-dependent methyltransferase [Punctularia strigosozonata HHB-11173 SS5]